jgi:hypothetical protein
MKRLEASRLKLSVEIIKKGDGLVKWRWRGYPKVISELFTCYSNRGEKYI